MNKVEFYENIQCIIKQNIKNDKMLNELTLAFTKKGLNINVPSLLFNEFVLETKNNEDNSFTLDNNDLICLGYFFMKKGYKTNPEQCFSDLELVAYDQYVVMPNFENTIKKVQFKEFKKISDKIYLGYLSPDYYNKLRQNKKIAYYKGLQRKSTIVKAKNGNIYEKATINKKNVKELEKRYLAKDMMPTTITLTILKTPNKKLNFNVEKVAGTETIYNIEIVPDFNRNSDTYTPLIISDGMHRYTGLCNAENKEDLSYENSLAVMLFISDEEETKQYIKDVFKRSDTDKDYLDSLVDDTNESKAAEEIIKRSFILCNNTGSNIKDCKFKDITYKKVIINTLKNIDINLDNIIEMSFTAAEIGKKIDLIINYLSNILGKTIDELKKTNLLKPFSIAGYIFISNEMINQQLDNLVIKEICDKLIIMNDSGELDNLKMNTSNCNIKEVINKFKEVM